MSSAKPSLYVVERKEVVILVMLFVLVTVLAFTMGVKYGESVGKKIAHQEQDVHAELNSDSANGGVLGSEGKKADPGAEKKNESTEPEKLAEPHGSLAPHDEHAVAPPVADKKESDKEKKDGKDKEADLLEGVKKEEMVDHDRALPDTNSDEYLLGALKDKGIEAPGMKGAKLPADMKKMNLGKALPKAGSFVIQVGSYPSRGDAEQQVLRLKEHKINAGILPPTRDKQGEWFRVVLGSFSNKSEAERAAKSYKAKGAIKSYFVRKMN